MNDFDLRPGMFVLSVDGQKLGRVARLEGDGFDVVRGRKHPRGFFVGRDQICSVLKAEIFLRLPLHDYVGRYEPRAEAAPGPHVRVGLPGKRFFIGRRNEARW